MISFKKRFQNKKKLLICYNTFVEFHITHTKICYCYEFDLAVNDSTPINDFKFH